MEKPYQVEIPEEFEIGERKSQLTKVFNWIGKNFKFILVPGSVDEDLSAKVLEYEKNKSQRKMIRRFKTPLTIFGFILILFVTSLAIFPSWISPYPFEVANGVLSGNWGAPSPDHPLGQGKFGRDILARMIFGARSSLTVALPAITFSVIFGVILGVIAAYFGGWIDSIIMRICDIFLAFPGLILAAVFIAIMGMHIENIMLAVGILGVPGYARLIRGNVLQARNLPYVEAARVSGAGDWRIMFRHILPNCIQPVIIAYTFNIGAVILALAGLAFLGFRDPSLIEWGGDLSESRLFLQTAPWASFWPGFMILITVLGFMLFGDGLRDALDPRLKNL
ncbi:MAG: ABC transporter permease [Candidatus Lokiarchaeota archaeon]|nr:ABC transporter permease [Candidatus Lokiarchaeota archaeon]